ncbi:hypothetical protein FQN55_002097 [Onygenales sp. PD_40]|nr:hypothetical protein FQN55_002097 [Onygenales sp. PD_40]
MEWLEKEQAKVQQKLVEAIDADSDDDDDNKNDGASRDAATGDATDDDAAGDVDGGDATDDDVDGGVDVPGGVFLFFALPLTLRTRSPPGRGDAAKMRNYLILMQCPLMTSQRMEDASMLKRIVVQFSNGAPATTSVGRYTRFFELEPNSQDMVPTRPMTDSDAKIMKKNITPGKTLGRGSHTPLRRAPATPFPPAAWSLGVKKHGIQKHGIQNRTIFTIDGDTEPTSYSILNPRPDPAPSRCHELAECARPFSNIQVATLGPGEVTGVPVTLSHRAEAPFASVGPLSTRASAPPDVSAAHHPQPSLCRTRSTHDPRPTPCCSRGPDARHAVGWRPCADHQGCGQGRTAFAPIDPAQHASIHSLCEAIAADSGYPIRVTVVTSNIPFRNQIKCLEEICTNCAPKHVNWKQFLLANDIRLERVGIVDTFASIDPDELDILLPCIRADANFNTNQGLGF